jgi:hypothetical protein
MTRPELILDHASKVVAIRRRQLERLLRLSERSSGSEEAIEEAELLLLRAELDEQLAEIEADLKHPE